MTRGTASAALVSRALGLCERIRGFAAREMTRARVETEEVDAFDSLLEEDIESTVHELIGLLDGISAAGADAGPMDDLKTEVGFTLMSIEDAIRTVSASKNTVRDLLSESRTRREAIRAYDIIHAS
jgi:hypothetical protein